MNLYGLAWREMRHRRASLVSGLLAITLGVAVIVGIRSVSVASERAVAVKLDSLGANVLVLPQGASVDDYHTADIDAPTIPESYVERIVTSALPGVDNVSPRLTRRMRLEGVAVVLTGVLPRSEVASQPIWQLAGIEGDDLAPTCDPNSAANRRDLADERLQRKPVEELGRDDVLLGSEVAERFQKEVGAHLEVQGRSLRVAVVLPSTGTVDDDRVYMHLHAMQEMLGVGSQVSAIEIMGCCNAISEGLLSKLRNVLPDTRVTGIAQIVSTQIATNRLMDRVSWGFLFVVLLVGGLSIGNAMWANVSQRRREIGTYQMLGMPRWGLQRLLLTKAVTVGLLGGVLGYALGTGAGLLAGPWLAGIHVRPIPALMLWGLALAVGVSLLGSLIPTWIAARLEPFGTMQET